MKSKYIVLADDVVLRRLEKRYVYKISEDELYEVGPDAYRFLKKLDGTRTAAALDADRKFLGYCVREKLVERGGGPLFRPVRFAAGPRPSLRYLELQITRRCARRCRHCYLGKPRKVDLSPKRILNALEQFEAMGGLRVMISGGEPLLHPRFEMVNEALPRFGLRKVLLTNGDFLNAEMARRLNVDEAQVSIDGMKKGHDALRGDGSHRKAVAALRNAKKAGKALSVATMIHRENMDELLELGEMLAGEGVREWGLDIPCAAGAMKPDSPFAVSPEEAGELLRLAFGGAYHGGADGWACGRHLATVTPEGDVLKCGFYGDAPLGTIEGGLERAWKNLKHIKLSQTECGACEFAAECGGGCRYRAGDDKSRDIAMCAAFGKIVVKPPDWP